uniref:Trehalase n=1 Tax=Meloidogyne incognita TaxID=6306 RepID=A0A914MFS8_MELIC
MWGSTNSAETGWDFSTRWFAQEGPSMHDFKSIRTLSIVPVDLNAFMCINMRILASFYEIFGDFKRKNEYYARYQKMKLAMKTLHWNETDGIWSRGKRIKLTRKWSLQRKTKWEICELCVFSITFFPMKKSKLLEPCVDFCTIGSQGSSIGSYDFDLERSAHSATYYVSNALPLYAKCFDDEDETTPFRIYDYLKREGVLNFTKGIPTSLAMSSVQQWDKENAWPPMVHMIIEGFRTSGDQMLMKAAENMATQWLIVNYKSYVTTYAMFEKYNASLLTEECGAGGGGEYEVQVIFIFLTR